MEGWDSFFLGQVGASAALAGMLFVAISLNLNRILSFPTLPDRALIALVLLLAILVVSSLMLIPGQSRMVIGLETLVVAIALAALAIRAGMRLRADTDRDHHGESRTSLVMFWLTILLYGAGGIIAVAGNLRAGLYWVAAAIIASFAKAILDAWVLLVEINR